MTIQCLRVAHGYASMAFAALDSPLLKNYRYLQLAPALFMLNSYIKSMHLQTHHSFSHCSQIWNWFK